ncbi:uncharacterized protein MYCGRDRAFT_109999 [Zymoseptoria tritici IPO323]|uniref:Uncharacterized protein n=1 Tax=Zymoseptoria tritici (strain CBS 115943 / IPO323) TaxID=336722 RepID=F9XE89_ZYMTI|nr:uncharacterized protein MYCGRDRAFT_109999 [Zymoseptoria tritici IPO323]EGP86609.1 hypothetical protein MYCGRDRAFT_109999 [Zymoseptoria tritici IPO323]
MFKRLATAACFALVATAVLGQQQCYYGPGAQYRGGSNLVPCNTTGTSACCLQGDTCLSGNSCYNVLTGNVYIAASILDFSNAWVCHAPESCGCEWNPTPDMLVLTPRGCKDMGSDALVALYAPKQLAPYVSLPSKAGGSTGYYSPTIGTDGTSSWVETAVPGYTPTPFTQLTTYRKAPTTSVYVDASATPGPSTYAAAASYSAPPSRSGPTSTTSTSSAPLATSSSNSSSDLSTGAKAGIGGGIAGGVLFLAAIALLTICLRRRRNRRKQPPLPGPPSYPHSPYSTQSPMQGISPWPQYPAGVISEQYFSHAGHLPQYRQTPPSVEDTAYKHQPVQGIAGRPLSPLELAADAPLRHEMAVAR